MIDISAIILVDKEELHIKRCLERLRNLNPRQVVELKTDENPQLITISTGWTWNFWQELWYRCLVDYEIRRMKQCTI